jgi:hypothetical protein
MGLRTMRLSAGALLVAGLCPGQQGEPMSEVRRGVYRSTPRGLAALLPHYGCGCYRSLCRKLDGVSIVRLLTASAFSWAWLHAQVILPTCCSVSPGVALRVASCSGPSACRSHRVAPQVVPCKLAGFQSGSGWCLASRRGCREGYWVVKGSVFYFLTIYIVTYILQNVNRKLHEFGKYGLTLRFGGATG